MKEWIEMREDGRWRVFEITRACGHIELFEEPLGADLLPPDPAEDCLSCRRPVCADPFAD